VIDGLLLSALSVVPKNAVTRLMGRFARSVLPRALHRAFLRWYIGHYGVDMSECQGGIDDFDTFTDFFTRPLKPGLRPICADADALVSPVDGKIYACGRIVDGRLPQSEGRTFRADTLVGAPDEPDAGRFDGGSYAVIYLSPKDYHRVHTPRAGTVTRFHYVPGELWPVFPAAARDVEGLFARNERLTSFLQTDVGEIAEVMVGAFGVGRIKVRFDDTVSNQGLPRTNRTLPAAWPVERCGELGQFEMGSTVILLLPPGVDCEWSVKPGDVVRLGAPIARVARR